MISVWHCSTNGASQFEHCFVLCHNKSPVLEIKMAVPQSLNTELNFYKLLNASKREQRQEKQCDVHIILLVLEVTKTKLEYVAQHDWIIH